MKLFVALMLYFPSLWCDPGITIDVDIFIHRPDPGPTTEIH